MKTATKTYIQPEFDTDSVRDIIGVTARFVTEGEAKRRTIDNARAAFEKRMARAESDLAEQQIDIRKAQDKARSVIERAIGAKLVTRGETRWTRLHTGAFIFGAAALIIMGLNVV